MEDVIRTSNRLNNLNTLEPNYYVAIGASAGGLEALLQLFQRMPIDANVAFIVIQHLSPDYKSAMADILARETDLEVRYIEDGMTVERNTIYLITPRKNMMIAKGKLILVDKMPERGDSFPIDIFFRSLAADKHHRTIAVILSGTGSDGSRGIQAIKEVGGLVIVQEPNNAKFDGMPFSAVRSGYADMILDIEQIPDKLVNYINHPILNGQERSLVNTLSGQEQVFVKIMNLVKENSKIDFMAYKTATILRRLERRIGVHQLRGLSEYFAVLVQEPQEVGLLAKDMLIGVTRFFRDSEYFAHLQQEVMPKVLAMATKQNAVRIWVAGCSTGEEAYSVAIALSEAFEQTGTYIDAKVFATDVDSEAISAASAGRFNVSIGEDMSVELLNKYFIQDEDHYTIAPKIRQMIVFATHNLMNDPPFSNTQLILCRNVLIYFQSEAQKRVISMFNFALQKGGFLFLGPSETLGELSACFDVVHERSRLYQKVSVVPPKHQLSELVALKHVSGLDKQITTSYQKKQDNPYQTPFIDALVSLYIPPCILVSDQYEVLHFFGDVSFFVSKPRTGAFSADIRGTVNPSLSVPVATALNRAKCNEGMVQYGDVLVESSDLQPSQTINLRICYLQKNRFAKESYLILFEPKQCQTHVGSLTSEQALDQEVIPYKPSDQQKEHIKDLESQLKNKQEHLQITVEELETTNEELQSSNEELLAANEELQSTNEELYSINSEYHDKISELTQLTNKVNNLITSTDLGIVFLDDALLIREFTPAATATFNVMPSDLNRPFHHISSNLRYGELIKDLTECIKKRSIIEQELVTLNDRNVLLTIRPFINEQSQPEGVVVVVSDITHVRSLEHKLISYYTRFKESMGKLFNESEHLDLHVLILDDREADRLWIGQLLKELPDTNYALYYAADTEEASALLKAHSIDICLIDYQLDSENALDFIEALNASHTTERLPVFILLSQQLTPKVYERAAQLPIYDTLSKDQATSAYLNKCIECSLQKREWEQLLKADVQYRQASYQADTLEAGNPVTILRTVL